MKKMTRALLMGLIGYLIIEEPKLMATLLDDAVKLLHKEAIKEEKKP